MLVGKRKKSWEQQNKRGKNLGTLSFQKESKLITPFWKENMLFFKECTNICLAIYFILYKFM